MQDQISDFFHSLYILFLLVFFQSIIIYLGILVKSKIAHL